LARIDTPFVRIPRFQALTTLAPDFGHHALKRPLPRSPPAVACAPVPTARRMRLSAQPCRPMCDGYPSIVE
jgi:hypothetical protein